MSRPARRLSPLLLLVANLAAQEPLPQDVLQGAVVDSRGAPVAGATVEVHRRPSAGMVCLDLPQLRRTRRVQVLRTGKNGTFATQLPRGVPFELHFDDGVNAPIVRRWTFAGEEVQLQVVPAARATLKLSFGDGTPCPGGTLEAWDAAHVRWVDASIDAEGRWTSGRLPPGSMTFDIAPGAARRPTWHTVGLESGVTTPIELTLEHGCVLTGRVTDADTGAPIVGARIGEGWTMDKFVVTDRDGRYTMIGYGAEGYGEVRVTADGYGPELREVKNGAEKASADFALVRGFEVKGRIVDAAGKPAAGVYVAAIGGIFSGGGTHDWCSASTDADGRYSLIGLRPQFAHTLLVRAEGAASLVLDLPDCKGKVLELPDVALRAGRYVSGVVVDTDGKPLPGVEMILRGVNPDRPTLLGAVQHDMSADYCLAVRTMPTDSKGRIHFADVPPGHYVLGFEDRDGAPALSIDVEAGADPEPVRIER